MTAWEDSDLSSRAFASVQRSFPEEAEKAFRFLITDFGYAGPERTDEVLQQVSYARSGVRCRIALDHSEMSVMAEVEVELGDTLMIASLDNLVSVAGIAPGNKVPRSVHTVRSLGKALAEQAKFLRSVLPYLEQETISNLMEGAGARQWHSK
ncbi:MAG: hypothetical protein JO345_13305 [Streptosporangiaceae bacterium]|nr:hypothetical protein [Streptosporangiaceae bacterium]